MEDFYRIYNEEKAEQVKVVLAEKRRVFRSLEKKQPRAQAGKDFWDCRSFRRTKEHLRVKMAESIVNETVANLSAAVNETAKNATGRAAATPEGMLVAYSSLVLMALLPIFFGSFRSVKYLIEQKVRWWVTIFVSFLAFIQLLFCRLLPKIFDIRKITNQNSGSLLELNQKSLSSFNSEVLFGFASSRGERNTPINFHQSPVAVS